MERVPTHELRIRAIPNGYSHRFYLQREHLIPGTLGRYRTEWITIDSYNNEDAANKALEDLNNKNAGWLK